MKTQSVQKQISSSSELYTLIKKRADVQKEKDLLMVDEETEKLIGKGLEDLRKGRFTEIKTQKELDAYLESLQDVVALSDKNEKRYIQMRKDFDNKKNVYSAHSVKALIKQLNEHSLS